MKKYRIVCQHYLDKENTQTCYATAADNEILGVAEILEAMKELPGWGIDFEAIECVEVTAQTEK